ncbi:hypothetical protein AB0B57_03590 [Micromonospora sp. NPDC049101]|uniref:hypothetical protein n=1 Tax=Micromonospora sp. NPDC049101 TaxID=3155032 RepID=UPI0033F9DF18
MPHSTESLTQDIVHRDEATRRIERTIVERFGTTGTESDRHKKAGNVHARAPSGNPRRAGTHFQATGAGQDVRADSTR